MRHSKLKILAMSAVFASMTLVGCDATLPTYSISFAMDDGTVLYTGEFKKGQIPSYSETPVKVEDNDGIYTFAGWDREPVAAREDTTYYATFSTQKKYSASFVDWDGSAIDVQYLVTGATPTLPADPTREDGPETHFYFTGWSPEVTAMGTESVIYRAQYNAVKTWAVQFVAEDGEILANIRVPEGEIPVYPYGTPKIPDDKETGTAYEFVRWDREFTEVHKDETYVAYFREIESKENWTAAESHALSSLCLFELPFYKARFEILSNTDDGFVYLKSGRDCDSDDYDNYCDILSDVTTDEIKVFLKQQGVSDAELSKIGKYAFEEVDNMSTIQDTYILDADFGEGIEWRFFRTIPFGLTMHQIVAVGFDEANEDLYVVETMFYGVSTVLYYNQLGYAAYPFTYEETNDIYDDLIYFASYALNDVYGSDNDACSEVISNEVKMAMPSFVNTDTSKNGEAYIEFVEYSYVNPFTYGNMYSQNYYCPQYEFTFNIVEESDYTAYLNKLSNLGFVYDESMSDTTGDFPYKAYTKTIVVPDPDEEGPFARDLTIFVGDYDTQKYIDSSTGNEFDAGYFWASYTVFEAEIVTE